jgi:hypothetical protein
MKNDRDTKCLFLLRLDFAGDERPQNSNTNNFARYFETERLEFLEWNEVQ